MKKNMFDECLDCYFPYNCYFCGKISDLACNNCLNELRITFEKVKTNNFIDQEFYISERFGLLEQIVDDMKFHYRKDNCRLLAEILTKGFKGLKQFRGEYDNLCIVPIPTSEKHARERGFRHIELISKEFCRLNSLEYFPVLGKITNSQQRGASAKVRKEQAEKAYQMTGDVKEDKIYILIDDIKTTGATLNAAAKKLKESGAKAVFAIYLMHQPI